jgi:hypothetical protein
MRTLEVFQREFVKRDYKLVPVSPINSKKSVFEAPLFF